MRLAWLFVAAAFLVKTGAAAPLIAPGAPGQLPRVITPARSAELATAKVTAADVKFMRDMIHHHQQAVDMVALLRTRTEREDLHRLGERIAISQAGEIAMMNNWLDRHAPGSGLQAHHGRHGAAHDMSTHGAMSGMLTPLQMEELAAAKGPAFDRLFLMGMIQHHTGALDMVRELISTPDAGEESNLSKFLADIYVGQSAEIARMQALLTAAESAARS